MAYKLRFVQRFKPNKKGEFMELEKKFIYLEQTVKEFPKGKRFIPFSGREPVNTLIWECEFPTLEEANQAIDFLEHDQRHEELYKQQVQYFLESFTEVYEILEE
jgi:hypothetical protein